MLQYAETRCYSAPVVHWCQPTEACEGTSTSSHAQACNIKEVYIHLLQTMFYLGLYVYRFQLRLQPESGTFSKSGRNPAKIPPEPDSFAGFEKSIFGMLNVRLFRYFLHR